MRNVDPITFRSQCPQNVKDSWKDIQICGGADVSFIWWKAKQLDRQFDLIPWRGAQSVPATQATGEAIASIFERNRLLSSLRNAAVDERLCGAVDFRYRDLHS